MVKPLHHRCVSALIRLIRQQDKHDDRKNVSCFIRHIYFHFLSIHFCIWLMPYVFLHGTDAGGKPDAKIGGGIRLVHKNTPKPYEKFRQKHKLARVQPQSQPTSACSSAYSLLCIQLAKVIQDALTCLTSCLLLMLCLIYLTLSTFCFASDLSHSM